MSKIWDAFAILVFAIHFARGRTVLPAMRTTTIGKSQGSIGEQRQTGGQFYLGKPARGLLTGTWHNRKVNALETRLFFHFILQDDCSQ